MSGRRGDRSPPAPEEEGNDGPIAQATVASEDDASFEATLRPERLLDYVGQEPVRESLAIAIEAARGRGEPLDHLLLSGPPGLGKTSLAQILAREMGVQCRRTQGPAIERSGDLAAILSDLERGDVLFIDEIHGLPRKVEEVLYPAMEDFELDLIVGQGPTARSMRLALRPFTLVAATTRPGLLNAPLRDRFGASHRLEYYSVEELTRILERSARILAVPLDASGAAEIARRSRGTPRIANRHLKWVRDFAWVHHSGRRIDKGIASAGLELHRVDLVGLEPMDHAIVLAVLDRFAGGPVGIESLAALLGEERETLEAVYEPYLVQSGYLERTPRGRMATPRAYEHFGRVPPSGSRQGRLL
jgi:Holliday junction DNA helicase RuvB